MRTADEEVWRNETDLLVVLIVKEVAGRIAVVATAEEVAAPSGERDILLLLVGRTAETDTEAVTELVTDPVEGLETVRSPDVATEVPVMREEEEGEEVLADALPLREERDATEEEMEIEGSEPHPIAESVGVSMADEVLTVLAGETEEVAAGRTVVTEGRRVQRRARESELALTREAAAAAVATAVAPLLVTDVTTIVIMLVVAAAATLLMTRDAIAATTAAVTVVAAAASAGDTTDAAVEAAAVASLREVTADDATVALAHRIGGEKLPRREWSSEGSSSSKRRMRRRSRPLRVLLRRTEPIERQR